MRKEITYDGMHDEQFQKPYVDVDEWRNVPVRHRYIHGGFEGTLTRFCFYYPPQEIYTERFFQFVSPFVGDEKEAQGQEGEEDKISFAVTHGSYLIETNLGGIVNGGDDHTLVYRASAAAAQFSRKLASQFYGEHRPYGYIYGGSGGAYKSISCVENTVGVWDGAVPFVIGSPVALPNVFTVRVHAMRILRHKMKEIQDALEPGGSGNPYACLNEEEKAALREAELMGFPMKTWCVYDTIGEGALPVLIPGLMRLDATYCKDFWELPGYLGTDPEGSAQRDRIVMESRIMKIFHPEKGIMGIADSIDVKNSYGVDEAWKHAMNRGHKLPVFVLDPFMQGDFYSVGLKMRFLDGNLKGEQFDLIWLGENAVTIDVGMDQRNLTELMAGVKEGDWVELDNSDYIALQTYHRHQVPGTEYHAWDQFRDEAGNPAYPQRSVLTGPLIATGGAGSVQNGRPNCKIIILESLMDESAFPWQADWYCSLVKKNAEISGDEKVRLWYMENCMHTDCQEGNGGDHQHIVSYLGALYQALLDLSAWVEKGIAPAGSSEYVMDGGQVIVAKTAEERKGVQPVVNLVANGTERAEINAGEVVIFNAEIELPEGSGIVEEVKWDFEATNQFLPGGNICISKDGKQITAQNAHCFERPGTYFPVVKVATNRNENDSFTRIRNQARVRVVVS